MLATIAAVSWQWLFDDPKLMGSIGLVLAAATFVGIVTTRYLKPKSYAREFGMLAAFAFTAALAYAGVGAAGAIMYVLAAVLILVWILTAVANF